MQLIGMLDSPYVRREATVFHILELPFEHLGVVSENGKYNTLGVMLQPMLLKQVHLAPLFQQNLPPARVALRQDCQSGYTVGSKVAELLP